MQNIIKKLFVLTLFLINSGCFFNKTTNDLIVLTTADIPPYCYNENNEYKGFEVDLLNSIGKIIKKNIVFKQTYQIDIIKQIQEKQADCAIGAFCRDNDEDFSTSYIDGTYCIMSHALSGHIQDFGKSMSVLSGSAAEKVANSIFHYNEMILKPLQSNAILVEDFLDQDSHFYLTHSLHAKEIVTRNKNFFIRMTAVQNHTNKIAILIKKDLKLKNDINNALKVMEKNNTIEQLRQKWNITNKSDLHNEIDSTGNTN